MDIFGEKLPGLHYKKRQGAYAVVIDSSKKKCMTVKTTSGHHFLPGGGIEGHETPKACLQREMLEETGYEVRIGERIGQAQRYFLSPQNEPLSSEASFYVAKLLEKVQEPTEVDHTVTWIDLEHLEGYLYHSHHEWAMRQAVR